MEHQNQQPEQNEANSNRNFQKPRKSLTKNKPLLYVIVGIGVLLLFLIIDPFSIFGDDIIGDIRHQYQYRQNLVNEEQLYGCVVDTECVLVQEGWCGAILAVNKNKESQWKEEDARQTELARQKLSTCKPTLPEYVELKNFKPSCQQSRCEAVFIGELPQQDTQVIDIDTWQTYRNEEFGFEFQYPSDWYVRTVQLPAYGDTFVPAISIGESIEGRDPSRVQIVIWKGPEDLPDGSLNFEQWILMDHSVYLGNYLPAAFENFNVGPNGYPAFKKQESTTIGIAININSVFLETNGKILNFRVPLLNRVMKDGVWGFDANYEEVEGRYDQILSTFRFVE